MELHCKMVRSAKGIAHVAYARHFAYSSIAAYESVVACDRSYRSLTNQLNGLNNLPSPKGNIFWPASLSAAYADMLRNFYSSFPACNALINSIEQAMKKSFLVEKIAQKKLIKVLSMEKQLQKSLYNGQKLIMQTVLKGEGVWTPTNKPAAPFWAGNSAMTNNLFSVYSLTQPVLFHRYFKEFLQDG